ncbi:MAG: hypothetical protein KatS3mg059_1529 [Thermomicrobiales bacterium]|nr:MAG: hypothetical protein KatS3mg059_1529 [Thermomicrobiales bacterium]
MLAHQSSSTPNPGWMYPRVVERKGVAGFAATPVSLYCQTGSYDSEKPSSNRSRIGTCWS